MYLQGLGDWTDLLTTLTKGASDYALQRAQSKAALDVERARLDAQIRAIEAQRAALAQQQAVASMQGQTQTPFPIATLPGIGSGGTSWLVPALVLGAVAIGAFFLLRK